MMGPESAGLRMLGMRIKYKPAEMWEGPKEGAGCWALVNAGISPALPLHASQGWWDSWCMRIVATQFPWGRGNKNTTRTSAQHAHSSGRSQSRLLRVLVSWVLPSFRILEARSSICILKLLACPGTSGLPQASPCSCINRKPKA